MTTFFSCDVETTSTSPLTGHLLTLGIQPVRFGYETGPRSNERPVPEVIPQTLYVRIDQQHNLDEDAITGMWGDPDNDASSFGWWQQQNDEARNEAYADQSLVRHDILTAAGMVKEYVESVEPDPRQRIFVANPVSFDKPWFEMMFWTADVSDPFHYQSLCLRSMKFGIRKGTSWVATRDNHAPRIPHHALWDAIAQADDLVSMLVERDG